MHHRPTRPQRRRHQRRLRNLRLRLLPKPLEHLLLQLLPNEELQTTFKLIEQRPNSRHQSRPLRTTKNADDPGYLNPHRTRNRPPLKFIHQQIVRFQLHRQRHCFRFPNIQLLS